MKNLPPREKAEKLLDEYVKNPALKKHMQMVAKAMAAYRVGIKDVIIPAQNKKDLVEIPNRIRRHLNFIPVKKLDEVLGRVLMNSE